MPARHTLRRSAALLVFAAAWAQAIAQPQSHDEARVKAAVVLQLARFVEWPSTASPAPIFNICVAGKDSWSPLLEHAAQGQTIAGKPVFVKRLTTPEEARSCHIAVLGPSVRPNLRAAIAQAPILTVSDELRFAAAGGMVGLAVVNGRVVFELAPQTARQKGIRFSSKLIRLARIVERED